MNHFLKMKYNTDDIKLYWGNAMELVFELPEKSIQTVVTSPTYWGKRKFTEHNLELGSESMEKYVESNVFLYLLILGQLLKDDGSLFVIIQDTYMGSGGSRTHHTHKENVKDNSFMRGGWDKDRQGNTSSVTARHDTIKNKSLCGIPFRIAIELVDKGYIWRENIIWDKPNSQPEPSADDRVRQSSEYILHFVKSRRYKFNKQFFQVPTKDGKFRMDNQVWMHSPAHKKGHTATFPFELVERLMLATSDEGDTIFDPFVGSGTMLKLAMIHNRKFIGCDINKKFIDEIVTKLNNDVDLDEFVGDNRVSKGISKYFSK